jgi:hypothetical protein
MGLRITLKMRKPIVEFHRWRFPMKSLFAKALTVFSVFLPSMVYGQASLLPEGNIFFIIHGTFEFYGGRQDFMGFIKYDSSKNYFYEEDQYFKQDTVRMAGHVQYNETDTGQMGTYTSTLDIFYDSITESISSLNYSRTGAPRYYIGTENTESISLSLKNLRYDSRSIYIEDSTLLNHLVSVSYSSSYYSGDGEDNIALRNLDSLDFEGRTLSFQSSSEVAQDSKNLNDGIAVSFGNGIFSINSSSGSLVASLYDLTGREIASIKAPQGYSTFPLNFGAGFYFLRVGNVFNKIFLF